MPYDTTARAPQTRFWQRSRLARLRRRWLPAGVAIAAFTAMLAPGQASAAGFAVGLQDPLLQSASDTEQEAGYASAADLGAKVVRLNVSWRDVAGGCSAAAGAALADPASPCYNWSALDAAVRRAQARGIDVLVSVSKTPAWANGGRAAAYTGRSNTEFSAFATRYATFVRAAARRYARGSGVGFVRYWTVWNEPNSRQFWAPMTRATPQRYAQLYALAAPAIKASSPAAQVAPGPTGPNSGGFKPVTFVRQVQTYLRRYRVRRAHINAWAHNPYSGAPLPPRRKVFRSPSVGIGNLRDLFRALDASPLTRRRPVWVTEFAYQTNPPDRVFGTSYARQASFMADAFQVAWATRRVPVFVWYVVRDARAIGDWQSGVLTAAGARKPSYAMFQRPVSVSAAGGRVSVWGLSNVSPATTQLVFRPARGGAWRPIPRSRRAAGGVRTATWRPRGAVLVAVRDRVQVGPARRVAGR